jgi:hypothetical protein
MLKNNLQEHALIQKALEEQAVFDPTVISVASDRLCERAGADEPFVQGLVKNMQTQLLCYANDKLQQLVEQFHVDCHHVFGGQFPRTENFVKDMRKIVEWDLSDDDLSSCVAQFSSSSHRITRGLDLDDDSDEFPLHLQCSGGLFSADIFEASVDDRSVDILKQQPYLSTLSFFVEGLKNFSNTVSTLPLSRITRLRIEVLLRNSHVYNIPEILEPILHQKSLKKLRGLGIGDFSDRSSLSVGELVEVLGIKTLQNLHELGFWPVSIRGKRELIRLVDAAENHAALKVMYVHADITGITDHVLKNILKKTKKVKFFTKRDLNHPFALS